MTPYLVVRELEPDGLGGQAETTAIFLTAATCPIGCSMCDLHRFTIQGPTPPGSIPAQIRHVIETECDRVPDATDRRPNNDPSSSSIHPPRGRWVKLYNSGNFFDPQSIPPEDYPEIAGLCTGFDRVIVENHPRFGSQRLARFHEILERPLEVAVGLETVQPRWLTRMRKQMTRDQFDQYAAKLQMMEIDLRVFLIVGVPGADVAESMRWSRLSVRHAVRAGARHISMIPARYGHGWDDSPHPLPRFTFDDWLQIQADGIRDADGNASITIDLWDLENQGDADPRLETLKQVNLTQSTGAA